MTKLAQALRERGLVDPVLVAIALVVFALDQVVKSVIRVSIGPPDQQGWWLDQAVKYLIPLPIGPGSPRGSIEVVGSLVRLSWVTNTGAAFGLLPDRTVFFTVVALVAVPVLLFSRLFLAPAGLPVRLSLGLLLGGTLGNLLDRLRLGQVVDFVDIGVNRVRWPSFNVADSAFVVGVIVLAACVMFTPESRPEDPEPTGRVPEPSGGVPGQPDRPPAA